MHEITRIPSPSSTIDCVPPFKCRSTEKVDSARAQLRPDLKNVNLECKLKEVRFK